MIGTAVEPLRLSPNPVHRFYRGGEAIARFRGLAGGADAPEEWLGSTTAAYGESSLGLSVLPDGRLLRDAVEGEPEAYLGPDHVARYGADTMLLVKLLDAGERLPVHYHPDDAFGHRLGFAHGKTEAWLIVEARPGAAVWLGFREDVDRETLRGLLDTDALLGTLNELPVAAGDLVFVPAGVPHAIGEGILIVELQQPSDLSVLLEWRAFGLDGGLELDLQLEAVELGAFDAGARPWTEEFFRVQRVRGGDRLEPGFSIVVVLDGRGRLGDLELARGDTVLVPFAAGTLELRGEIEAVRCRPPAGGE